MEIDQMTTEIQGPFHSNIGHAAAIAPIDMTAHSPGLTQVPEQVMDAQCTS